MSPKLRLIALALAIAAGWASIALTGGFSADRLRDWVDDAGVLAPIAFVLAGTILTCVLFPGPLIAGASGLLFGTALGFPVTMAAATGGATLAFYIARRFGHDAVEELSGERVKAIQAWIERRGFLAVLYARLTPGMPYSLVNYAAGLSRVRYWHFAAGTFLGAAPRAFAYTALGGSLENLGSPEAIVAIVVLVVMAVGGAIPALRDRRRRRARAQAQPAEADPAPSA